MSRGVATHASLNFSVESTKQVHAKSLVQLKLINKFSENVASARASVFLLDDQGKVVAQSVKWIIDATKDKNGLKPDETLNYTFVLNNEKPFTSAKVTITRVVLESGKVVIPAADRPTSIPSPTPAK